MTKTAVFWERVLPYLALWILVALVYSPAVHGGLIMDDAEHITPEALRSLQGLGRIWFEIGATPHYYPVLNTVFWVQYHLWGTAATGYHLINIAEQAAAACVVVMIVRRLNLPGAFLAGFIFAVHPVHVETVAWISEQKNTLSTLLALLSSWVFFQFVQSRKRSDYALSLALFVFALLTKTVVAVVPPALLVVLWWQKGKLDWRKDVCPLLPWIFLGASLGLFSAWFEQVHSNARGQAFDVPLLLRILIAGRAVWFYLRTLVWPQNLMFINPRWEVSVAHPADYFGVAGVLGATIVLASIARRSRGPLATFLLFVGMLFPVLGLLNINWFNFSYVANHFQHLPSVAIITCFSVGLHRLLVKRGFRVQAACGIKALVVIGLSWTAYVHCEDYRSAETLYLRTIAKNPACWLAYNNLGVLRMEQEGGESSAAEYFARAIALKPDHARAHNNLASALLRLGRVSEALEHYRSALQFQGSVPEVHLFYARALISTNGNREEALEHCDEAARLRPGYIEALQTKAELLADWPGRKGDAAAVYRELLAREPSSVTTMNNLATVLADEPSERDEAILLLRQALTLAPDYVDARFNLAMLLAARPGHEAEAREHLTEVLRCDPNNADVRAALGRMTSRR